MDALRIRAEMLRKTRAFFARRHVLEVQTPVLGTATVTDPAIDSMRLGAAGRYLQTSPEYHMKRLLAAGAPSIYQLGPVFRAGEQGRWHNPEFTLLEWYRLGFDAAGLIAELSELIDDLLGPGTYLSRTYADLIGDRFGVAPTDTEACLATARHLGLGADADPEQALDLVLAQAIASSGEQRLYITGFPPDQAALARLADDGTASRFELVIDGVEVANGYHELCDASELKRRMAADNVRRSAAGRPRSRPTPDWWPRSAKACPIAPGWPWVSTDSSPFISAWTAWPKPWRSTGASRRGRPCWRPSRVTRTACESQAGRPARAAPTGLCRSGNSRALPRPGRFGRRARPRRQERPR